MLEFKPVPNETLFDCCAAGAEEFNPGKDPFCGGVDFAAKLKLGKGNEVVCFVVASAVFLFVIGADEDIPP